VADDGNTGRSMVTAGIIVASVGAAAVAGGLIWQLGFNHPEPAAARLQRGVRVAPLLSPAQQGLLVTGRF
jgi:hypothetical protein